MSGPKAKPTEAKNDGFFRWEVAIEIDPTWVADGFDLTPERLQSIFERALAWARSSEIRTEVLAAPDARAIRVEQGYPVPAYAVPDEERR